MRNLCLVGLKDELVRFWSQISKVIETVFFSRDSSVNFTKISNSEVMTFCIQTVNSFLAIIQHYNTSGAESEIVTNNSDLAIH